METVNVGIDEKTYERLKKYADSRGVKYVWLLTKIVTDYLRKEGSNGSEQKSS